MLAAIAAFEAPPTCEARGPLGLLPGTGDPEEDRGAFDLVGFKRGGRAERRGPPSISERSESESFLSASGCASAGLRRGMREESLAGEEDGAAADA